MAGGPPARGCAGGGEVVSPSRSTRARVATGATALALAGGLGAATALAGDSEALRTVGAAVAGTACLLLAVGLVLRLGVAIAAALGLLGFEYALVLLVDGGPLDTRAPFLAAGLFAAAELAFFSLELRDAVADEPGTYLRRAAAVAALAVCTAALGLGILALVELAGRGGPLLELAGAAAAVAALALLARAALAARADAPGRL